MVSAILAKHGLQNLHLINASFVILHNVIVSWITRLDTKPAWIRLKNRRFYVQVKNSLIVENGKNRPKDHHPDRKVEKEGLPMGV